MSQLPSRLMPWLTGLLVVAAVAIGSVPGDSRAATLPTAIGGQPLPSLAPMLTRVTPAVVNISTTTRVQVRDAYFDDPMVRQFFGLPATPRERVEQSLGSGVIVDAAKGYVLTNNHVVGGADDISVTLQDGRTFKGKLIGTDPGTDVAVVQIPAQNLKALPLADSSALQVGDYVVAVGDPFGLGQTVTAGIVSALGRSGLGDSGYQNFIQTDASINPGNSGGALVNARGELIGINTAIFSETGGYQGIGFAVPSNLARHVMDDLLKYGEVQRGTIPGIYVTQLTTELADQLGAPNTRGALVNQMSRNSDAYAAGLRPGDIILAFNGRTVDDASAFMRMLSDSKVGTVAKLLILRESRKLEITVPITRSSRAARAR